MADSDILREFLISLNFRINQDSKKKFRDSFEEVERDAKTTAVAVTGIAIAAQAMVKSFANEMEKLYYVSKRTNSSVENIQALESGAERVGVSATTAREALESMSAVMRTQPGMRSYLDSLTGGKTKGMEDAKALTELVKSLSSMPHAIGSQYASMFGMDEKTFLMLKQGMPELEAAEQRRLGLNKQLGIEADKLAKDSVDFNNNLRDINDNIKTMGMLATKELLPVFRELNDVVKNILIGTAKFIGKDKAKEKWEDKSWLEKMAYSWKNRDKNIDDYKAGKTDALGNPIDTKVVNGKENPITQSTSQLFSGLEKKYGLPSGTMDRTWLQESSRGKNMIGPPTKTGERAIGHFQFMSAAAGDYGVKDRNDLGQSAEGAAHYISDLRKKYKGDIRSALAAYNWGPGNFDRHGGLGHLPAETKKYVNDITGSGQNVVIHQKTDIHIDGSGQHASDIANQVGSVQSRVNADTYRNLQSKIQ